MVTGIVLLVIVNTTATTQNSFDITEYTGIADLAAIAIPFALLLFYN
jgi:hypothetical protein